MATQGITPELMGAWRKALAERNAASREYELARDRLRAAERRFADAVALFTAAEANLEEAVTGQKPEPESPDGKYVPFNGCTGWAFHS